jgi:hypothetical protein
MFHHVKITCFVPVSDVGTVSAAQKFEKKKLYLKIKEKFTGSGRLKGGLPEVILYV